MHFDRLEVQVVTVLSNRLGKTQNIAFLLMVDFLRVFEITQFLKVLKDFRKSSESHAKMVECI